MTSMISRVILLAGLAVAAGCSNTDSPEEIRERIREKQDNIAMLEKEIQQLEGLLGEDTSGVREQGSALSVAVMEAIPRKFEHYFTASGTLEAVSEAFISPETSGQVRQIAVTEGQRVRKGQVLARLNSSVIESNIAEIRTQLDYAVTVFSKQEELWKRRIGSEMEYLTAKNNKESLENRLKTAQAQLDMTVISSPLNGIVDKIMVKEGELASPGMQLMRLVNLEELYVNADISESYLPAIDKGDEVKLSFPTYPDLTMTVPVYRTGNVIDPQNRTFTLQLRIKNSADRLKPNLLALLELMDFSSDSALLVPSIALRQDMNGQYIYTVAANEDGLTAMKTYVETGMSYGDSTMISKGIVPGDRVIVKGYNIVSDGSRIAIRNQ